MKILNILYLLPLVTSEELNEKLNKLDRPLLVGNAQGLLYMDSSSPLPDGKLPDIDSRNYLWDYNLNSSFKKTNNNGGIFLSNAGFLYQQKYCMLNFLDKILCINDGNIDKYNVGNSKIYDVSDGQQHYLSGHTINFNKSGIIIGGALKIQYENKILLSPSLVTILNISTEDNDIKFNFHPLKVDIKLNSLIGHTSNVIGDKLYVIGGYDYTNNQLNNNVLVFDLSSDKPKVDIIASEKTMVYHNSFVWNDKIYLAGGHNSAHLNELSVTKDIHIYDPKGNKFTKVEDNALPYDLIGYSNIIQDKKLYILGGYKNNTLTPSGEVIVLDIKEDGKLIYKIEKPLADFDKEGFASVIIDNKVFKSGTNNSNINLGAIIGGCIGGLVGLFLIIGGIAYYVRKQRRLKHLEIKKAKAIQARKQVNLEDKLKFKPLPKKHSNLDRRNSNASILSADDEIKEESQTIPREGVDYKSTVLSSGEFLTDRSHQINPVHVTSTSTVLSFTSEDHNNNK